LALGALAAFYGLWLRPAPSLDPDADAARPTSAERRGNGYAALFEWLEKSGVQVRSWRERYTALADADIPPRGNLLVLTLPGVELFRNDEFAALDRWVRRGNTLLINAALLDQPGWAAGRESGVVTEVESLTSIEFETREVREARLDDTPARRTRAPGRRARREEGRRHRRARGGRRGRGVRGGAARELRRAGEDSARRHRAARAARRRSPARARNRLPAAAVVAAHAVRQLRADAGARRGRRGRAVRAAPGRGPHRARRGRHAVQQSRVGQRRQRAACSPTWSP
jgi:hypothetical protein